MESVSFVAAIVTVILFLVLPAIALVGVYVYVIFSSIRENLKSQKVNEPIIKDIPDKKQNAIMVVADTVDIDNYKKKKHHD